MDEIPPNTNLKNIMSSFQQVAHGIVDKYCSMPLLYKPGLYSIHWESSCRIAGLVDELQKVAHEKKQELQNIKEAELPKADQNLDNIITHSLMEYTEKIFNAEYPESEQPDWMLEIAQRLHKDTWDIH